MNQYRHLYFAKPVLGRDDEGFNSCTMKSIFIRLPELIVLSLYCRNAVAVSCTGCSKHNLTTGFLHCGQSRGTSPLKAFETQDYWRDLFMIVYELTRTKQHPEYKNLQKLNLDGQLNFLQLLVTTALKLDRKFLS